MKKLLFFMVVFVFLSGCAVNQIMKDCKKIDGTKSGAVCKTTKPWEDLE